MKDIDVVGQLQDAFMREPVGDTLMAIGNALQEVQALQQQNAALEKQNAELRALLAAQPAAATVRKAYICTSCESVYADNPVTQCDCMPDTQEYIEGTITYVAQAQDDGEKQKQNIDMSLPDVGSAWIHKNGTEYTVIAVANVHAEKRVEYPTTVVYKNESGQVWSRHLSRWHGSMKAKQ